MYVSSRISIVLHVCILVVYRNKGLYLKDTIEVVADLLLDKLIKIQVRKKVVVVVVNLTLI